MQNHNHAQSKSALSGVHPHLPTPLAPCVGRDEVLTEIMERLNDPGCRLVTLCGVGGIGKTRLALEVARKCGEQSQTESQFRHGVYFIPLVAVASGLGLHEALVTTIGEAVGFTFGGPEAPIGQLLHYLHEKSLLLVLDNLEHVPDAAQLVMTILSGAPSVKILTTSRERLKLRTEWVFDLEPLTYPLHRIPTDTPLSEQYGAVQLFLDTARTSASHFALNPDTSAAVVRICQLVEGLPLGIELAASWTRLLSCQEIAVELDRSLDLLSTTMHDVPLRHRSLRAVFDYSWDLLTPDEQQILRRLALFRGNFSREAAAAVGGVTLPLLLSLVDKSLVRRVPINDAVRYELPEMVRQFAAERLEQAGEVETTAERHAAFFFTMLSPLPQQLRGHNQQAALAAIALEIEHVRMAWRWAVDHADHQVIDRAIDSLFHFYDMRSWFTEGADIMAAAHLALTPKRSQPHAALVWSKALARHGWFIFYLGRQREAQELLEQSATSLRQLDARAELVFSLNYLAAVYSYLGDYARTNEMGQESLAITEANGDEYGRVVACNILGQAAYDQGDYTTARSWSQQSLVIEQMTGNRWSMAFSLTNLGKVAYALREYDAARHMFNESLFIRETMGDMRGMAMSLNWLGDTACAAGNSTDAATYYIRSLNLSREIGSLWGVSASLINIGQLAIAHQLDGAATRILQEALRLAVQTQAPPQVQRILHAFAPLLRRSREATWATELEERTVTKSIQLPAIQHVVDRLLAWTPPTTGAASIQSLSLERIIADVQNRLQTDADQHNGSIRPSPRSAQATFPAGLTAREVDVLRLVAQGLTDKEVAEQLIVSPRTVTTHLTSIYGKLQINTRAAATRFAVEQGLV